MDVSGSPRIRKGEMIMGTLKEIKLAEKIRLLSVGKKLGRNLDVKDLPFILEKVKTTILPLVEWLDKPARAKKRGVLFFESRFLNIWLERSGRWFINFGIYDPESEKRVCYVDSQELAEIMIEKQEDFLNLYLVDRNFLTELPFLRDIALYDAMVLRVLARFFEDVEKQLQEREERILLMKERLNLFNDFAQSLDLLKSQGKTVSINGYSIFNKDEHGSRRCTKDYFCPEALKPFWEVVKSLRSGGADKYEEVSKYRFESLGSILQQADYWVREVAAAGSKDAKSLFAYSSGRLPLTREELDVLKKLVDSITT